jgi:hypothetical protein
VLLELPNNTGKNIKHTPPRHRYTQRGADWEQESISEELWEEVNGSLLPLFCPHDLRQEWS